MASWLRPRSHACPHLGEDDALFVRLGPNQFAHRTSETGHTGAQARPPGERLTTDAVRTTLKRVAVEAGVGPHLVTPHRLRHYFGLTSAMAGVPTTALMRALVHRTPIMTARYFEFPDAERRWAFARADITSGMRLPGGRRGELGAPVSAT
jgi:integrase